MNYCSVFTVDHYSLLCFRKRKRSGRCPDDGHSIAQLQSAPGWIFPHDGMVHASSFAVSSLVQLTEFKLLLKNFFLVSHCKDSWGSLPLKADFIH